MAYTSLAIRGKRAWLVWLHVWSNSSKLF